MMVGNTLASGEANAAHSNMDDVAGRLDQFYVRNGWLGRHKRAWLSSYKGPASAPLFGPVKISRSTERSTPSR